MKKDATLFKRSIWYFVGLNLIAVSVVLNIRYDLGVAAFSSVTEGFFLPIRPESLPERKACLAGGGAL